MPSGHYAHVTRVPSAPLLAAVEHAASRIMGNLNNHSFDREGGMGVICARAGLSDRAIRRWRDEGSEANLDTVDRTLIALDRLWFDIYNEDTVRLPALTVRYYHFKPKEGKTRRILRRTTRYGDLGTDWTRLAEIERAFEGDLAAAA